MWNDTSPHTKVIENGDWMFIQILTTNYERTNVFFWLM